MFKRIDIEFSFRRMFGVAVGAGARYSDVSLIVIIPFMSLEIVYTKKAWY